ncbi:hypothetical protein QJQ45_010539 [Haematococcus lacustris]|nr:hypothetical protein QJQ45_010539 [Haematococcus lacustris]
MRIGSSSRIGERLRECGTEAVGRFACSQKPELMHLARYLEPEQPVPSSGWCPSYGCSPLLKPDRSVELRQLQREVVHLPAAHRSASLLKVQTLNNSCWVTKAVAAQGATAKHAAQDQASRLPADPPAASPLLPPHPRQPDLPGCAPGYFRTASRYEGGGGWRPIPRGTPGPDWCVTEVSPLTPLRPPPPPDPAQPCRFFVSEQCVLPNPHRPGKTSTVGREFHIVSTYMRRKTLGATHNSVAKRASAARPACGEIA